MLKRIYSFSNVTLLVALILSTIAAWYSIIGLTAIFAGAVIPIIVMGSSLELAKITTTVWLRKYWDKCSWVLKLYLVPAVIALALLTSMGIFGFLSKAHIDQGIGTGDVGAQVALFDEKIKTERDNIDTSKKALQQMDAQVDQILGRTDSDKGAERAVAIRRQQAKERSSLQNDIAKSQAEIKKFNEERAPIASQLRKVEAEVGPIKYIAALIYGDNPDQNVLERAVRWVIILLVLVFDPLALMLVIAANQSREWDKLEQDDLAAMSIVPPPDDITRPFTQEEIDALDGKPIEESKPVEEPFDISKHAYLFEPWVGATNKEPIAAEQPKEEVVEEPKVEVESTIEGVSKEEPEVTTDISTEGVTIEKPYEDMGGGYVVYDGKHMHKDVFMGMRPEFMKLTADASNAINTSFGIEFPKMATRKDIFVRVDTLPNRVYKFDGSRWIEVNKESSDTYLHDKEYLKFLIQMVEKGEYDVELLSDTEKQLIEEYLTKKS